MPASRYPSPHAVRADQTKTRGCLGCGDPFLSEGSHNRMCGGCKSTQAWRGGVNAAAGFIPTARAQWATMKEVDHA